MTYSELRKKLRQPTAPAAGKERRPPGRPPSASGPKAKAELIRERVAKMNEVQGPWDPEDISRRQSAEADLETWLRTYMATTFFRSFSSDQSKAIHRIQGVMQSGGLFAQAMPRGTGKTSIVEGATLYGIVTGKLRYCVLFGSDASAAMGIKNDLIKELSTNDLLLADYPEVCRPFRAIDGNHHRCPRQTVTGADGVRRLTYISIMGNKIVIPEHTASPHHKCSGAIIESFGITSSFRGRKHKLRDGSIIRPDFFLLDDPQTRESASSFKQTADREKIIFGDIIGLAGHDKPMAGCAAVTVIRRDDLAERILNHDAHPEWQGLRTKLVYSWPTNQKLWDQYKKLWIEDRLEGRQDTPTARAFYVSNRAAMDAGSVVASEEQKGTDEISAIQHAYHLRYSMGDAGFLAECQNEPTSEETTIYDLRPEMVQHRCNGRNRLVTQAEHVCIVAFTDINHSALHWTIAGFRRDFSMDVLAYGRTPETGYLVAPNSSETEKRQRIYAGLTQFLATLKGFRIPIARIGIDAGYDPELVARFVKSNPDSPVFASRGFASKTYRPSDKTVLQRWHNCHLADAGVVGRFVAHNADYWREVAQRAMLPAVGAPGSCSLYGSSPSAHREYAEQICAEILVDKARGDGGTIFYKWSRQVGSCNDWLDSHVGCYVSAATTGLTTEGQVKTQQNKYVETRKARVKPE